MALLSDPDFLKLSSQPASGVPDGNVYIDTSTGTIEFIPVATLATINFGTSDPDRPGKPTGTIANPLVFNDGLLLNAFFSFITIERKLNDTLRRYLPIIRAIDRKSGQYEFVNGFAPKTDTDRQFFRNGGWVERAANGTINRIYYGVVGIGSADSTEVFYYALSSALSTNGTNLTFTGLPNEAVRVDTSDRLFFEISGRTWQRSYTRSNLTLIGNNEGTGAFIDNHSLTTASDTFVTETESNVSTLAAYTAVTLNYLPGVGFLAWQSGVSYVQNAVVSFTGRWYRATSAHTSSTTNEPTDGGAPWIAYEGERLIGGTYYPFNKIFASGGTPKTKKQFYQRERWLLRQATNINQNSVSTGSIIGRRASPLFTFVSASQLDTELGVFIDDLNLADINEVRFRDATGIFRSFPRVTNVLITLNDIAKQDPDLRVSVYFLTAGSNTYPGANAVIVQDNTLTNIVLRPFTGTVNRSGWVVGTVYAANTVVEDVIGGTWYRTTAGGTSTGASLSADSGVTWVVYAAAGSYSYSFDYDGNTQGSRTAGTDAAIVAVSTGRTKAEEGTFSGSITAISGSVAVVMNSQRNFRNAT